MTANIQWVIFDLGGVLIELDGPPVSPENSLLTETEIWHQWLHSAAVRKFESGQCSAEEFAATLIEELQLNQNPAEFLKHFERWPKGLFMNAENLLLELNSKVRLACLSNTNLLHWRRFGGTKGLFDHFDQIFASFQTGHMKPDASAFEHAIKELQAAPHELLFFDDNMANVESARASGMFAELSRGPEEAKAHLKRYALL